MVTVQIDLIADLQYVHFNSSATLCPSPCPVYGRFHIFIFFNGCLLLSTIKGWMIKKPNLVLDHKMTQDEWSLMKNELKEWITFYLDLSVS